MNLMEYQAREVFMRYGIPVMRGVVLDSPEQVEARIEAASLRYPVVVKAQVPVGGRGKAGGVQFASDPAQAADWANRLMGMNIKGFAARQLLVVEKARAKEEWYLSIVLDRARKLPMVLFSRRGGVDIERHPESVVRATIDPFIGVQDYLVSQLIDATGIDPAQRDALKTLLARLLALFFEHHALLAEISPLIVDQQNALIALDGKLDIDDAALYNLPDVAAYRAALPEHPLALEARGLGFLYIPVGEGARVGVMSNGSGMLMSCIDLLARRGIVVGAALDLGGGATAERIREAVRILLQTPGLDTLLISIFGGITRCDEVAEGVRQALALSGVGARLVVRMEGTNRQAGLSILEPIPRVRSADSLPEAAAAVESLLSLKGGAAG